METPPMTAALELLTELVQTERITYDAGAGDCYCSFCSAPHVPPPGNTLHRTSCLWARAKALVNPPREPELPMPGRPGIQEGRVGTALCPRPLVARSTIDPASVTQGTRWRQTVMTLSGYPGRTGVVVDPPPQCRGDGVVFFQVDPPVPGLEHCHARSRPGCVHEVDIIGLEIFLHSMERYDLPAAKPVR